MPSNTSDLALSSTPTLSSRSLRSLSSRTGSVRDPQRKDSKPDGWLSLPDGLRTIHVRNDTGECPARNNTGECPVRLPDWEGRLIEWLGKASEQRFVWGEFDCALAAADALTAQTGLDFAKPWRGTYRTDKGALKALLRRGYRDCWEAMADALGTDSVPASLLSRGDIGAVNAAGMKTLGVIWAGSIWLPEPHGLCPHSIKLVSHGWQLDSPLSLGTEHPPLSLRTKHSPLSLRAEHSPLSLRAEHSPLSLGTEHSPLSLGTEHSPLSLGTEHSPLSLRTGIVRNPSGRESQPSGLSSRTGCMPQSAGSATGMLSLRCGSRTFPVRDDRVGPVRDENNKEKGVTICPR